MKLYFLFLLFVATSQAFLSKDWIAKEMNCFRTCMIEKGYDSYLLSADTPITCTCKAVKLNRSVCKQLKDIEYLQKFKRYKMHLIRQKIKPLFDRYNKNFPENPFSINLQSIKLTPGIHRKNIILT